MANEYRDRKEHFTYQENDGGECPHSGQKAYDSRDSVNRLKEVVNKQEEKFTTVEEIEALYGKEFKGCKGQGAIQKLLKEKQGHIKGAFHREDFGHIDLIWGNDNIGLQHILINRNKDKIDENDFLSNLAEVIEKGEYKGKNKNNTFELWYKGKMAIISPEYHGYKIVFLLTAFKRQKNKGSKTATL